MNEDITGAEAYLLQQQMSEKLLRNQRIIDAKCQALGVALDALIAKWNLVNVANAVAATDTFSDQVKDLDTDIGTFFTTL